MLTALLAAATVAASVGNAPKDLLAADLLWRQAILHKDRVALEKVVGADYTLTTANGVTPREQWMKSGVLWDTKVLEWREPPRVLVYGDAAVLSGLLRWHVLKDKPDPRTGTAELDVAFLVTDVWIRREGQWQVVARHSTIPNKP